MADSMDGFYTDPWAYSPADLGSGIADTGYDSWNTITPAQSVSVSNSDTSGGVFSGTDFSNINFSGLISGAQNLVDWGLKTTGTIFAAKSAYESQQMQNYLNQQKADITRTQVDSAAEVARIQAQTNENVAKIKANSANTAQQAVNFGSSNSNLMTWLTIMGVAFAGLQLWSSRK